MKRKTVYDMTQADRQAVIDWLDRKLTHREVGEILSVSHENVRVHLSGLIRQMYEEGYIEQTKSLQ